MPAVRDSGIPSAILLPLNSLYVRAWSRVYVQMCATNHFHGRVSKQELLTTHDLMHSGSVRDGRTRSVSHGMRGVEERATSDIVGAGRGRDEMLILKKILLHAQKHATGTMIKGPGNGEPSQELNVPLQQVLKSYQV